MSAVAKCPVEVSAYLEEGYSEVCGMSSRFSAPIIAGLLAQQTAIGVTGHVAEIGAFEGRLLIAMALSLVGGERALAIDTFDWPDEGVRNRFERNCIRHGVAADRLVVHQGDSLKMKPEDLIAIVGGRIRFLHVDGDHSNRHLRSDLRLAAGVVTVDGIIALDDMLHPIYPTIAVTVHKFLSEKPEWQVLAIIDRENISGSAKYLICKNRMIKPYRMWLLETFKSIVLRNPLTYEPFTASFGRHESMILTPDPRMPEFHAGGVWRDPDGVWRDPDRLMRAGNERNIIR